MTCKPASCVSCYFSTLKGCCRDDTVLWQRVDQGYGVSKYSGRPYIREAGKARGCYKMSAYEKAARTKGERA